VPGVAKVRRTQAVSARTLDLVALRDGWWSGFLEVADIASEGAIEKLADGEAYYGSTSIRCVVDPAAMPAHIAGPDALAALLVSDPHARLRLLRLAHRQAMVEASRHAGAELGVMQAEMTARAIAPRAASPAADTSWLLTIDIDVSAELSRGGRRAAR
jgi:hypothetical protein